MPVFFGERAELREIELLCPRAGKAKMFWYSREKSAVYVRREMKRLGACVYKDDFISGGSAHLFMKVDLCFIVAGYLERGLACGLGEMRKFFLEEKDTAALEKIDRVEECLTREERGQGKRSKKSSTGKFRRDLYEKELMEQYGVFKKETEGDTEGTGLFSREASVKATFVTLVAGLVSHKTELFLRRRLGLGENGRICYVAGVEGIRLV
ncbi:MAG: uncharacterized protein A8A55_1296 [Amphiamblys sp. WSBS2006]|nr:MAG: uncharacterized protein A8A55_1296 [Amphiamblys sp. WSBS2006]